METKSNTSKKAERTELVFILDRSGSMAGLESDTIGGYNSMLKKQKELSEELIVTTVLFDDQYEILHDRINLDAVNPMSEKDYYVRGSTALVDAIGKTITKIVNVQRNTAEKYRADKVIFVITTDGLENASFEYSDKQIKKMITHEQEKYGWEFIFLGANIDAISTATQYGFRENRAVNYIPDSKGVMLHNQVVSDAILAFRAMDTKDLEDVDILGEIEIDYQKRRKK